MRIVGGKWRGHPLEAPEGRDVTRPTTDRTRESIASMVLSAFGLDLSDVSLLDAFAGSGAIGLELLSRGAASATFVDRDRGAVARVRRNAKSLGASVAEAHVMSGDVFGLAERGSLAGAPFRLVVLDPPYAVDAERVSSLVASLAERGMLREGALVLYEHDSHAPGLDVADFTQIKEKSHGITTVELLRRNAALAEADAFAAEDAAVDGKDVVAGQVEGEAENGR
ncbi:MULTISPECIES: 16S rRNA (guanine(966)-N(2))-methyltransferase RsmD [Atopobiaceae]|uniref:16S rRNA (Guanine966-N2)-methyltransferase n=1 Tax=Parafannyhessea umbonata TaxID=604330 RepID=A0A1H9NK07_9ACTN|nr:MULTISPECIES: 16S rRNA (guanine(966)-N(2))-methyltransferase RsmD [Atopobiaceae]SEH67728.1 16S rRNA (guanine966-N2)-methyltransferase [Parafannyhessea umbonata]SER36005.1 16S rRNA (guanine966-N2)-methyltransferase [Parafannyhessea umbonata]SJZ88613.1 16S rRNA (guanine966-N2)-methyltransferase [Olsenella sp. KH1P3]